MCEWLRANNTRERSIRMRAGHAVFKLKITLMEACCAASGPGLAAGRCDAVFGTTGAVLLTVDTGAGASLKLRTTKARVLQHQWSCF